MKFKLLQVVFTFLMLQEFSVFAQTDNATLIDDIYQRASTFYEQGKFVECLTLLDRAETLASTPDAKVLYLKVKALYPLAQKEEKYLNKIEQALPKFLQVAQGQNYATTRIQEVLEYAQQIKTFSDAQKIRNTQLNEDKRMVVEIVKKIEESMVFIEGGKYNNNVRYIQYLMKKENKNSLILKSPYRVEISSFYCGKYEVTQNQWQAIMKYNPSANKNCLECPVENVSWTQIQEFLKKLQDISGIEYRLPSEAEWEYILIEGKKGIKRKDTNAYSWHSIETTQPVGKKECNDFKIHDILGNVDEYCLDSYEKDYDFSMLSLKDPINSSKKDLKVIRGTSVKTEVDGKESMWDFYNLIVFRNNVQVDNKSAFTGFRICRK